MKVNAPAPPIIATNSLNSGTAFQFYTATLQATGGVGALSWSIVQGLLPHGLSLSPGGVISGVPDTPGTQNFRVQVQDSLTPTPATDAKDLSITIAAGSGQLLITSTALPNDAEDRTYNAAVQTSGGVAPLNFSITAGALPNNVTLDPATGTLNGLHPSGGQHTFTVRVTDRGNPVQSASQSYAILILQVTTTTLPDASIGQNYGQSFAAVGQVPPTIWAPAPGTTLPAGLAISSAGLLDGIPTATGQFFFCIQVTDSDQPPRMDQQWFSLHVNNPAPTITSLTPPSVVSGSAAFTISIDGTGFIPSSEVRWNSAARPTTFVSGTRLTADISAADVAVVGTAAVTVFNPAPGGGLSNAATFTISAPPPPGGNVGVTDLVSQSSGLPGVPANSGSAITGLGGRLIAISQDGNRVAFASEATNLDGPVRGVFVRDMALGVTRYVSTTIANTTTDGVIGESLSISGDGNVVAFESRASNHVVGDTFGSAGPDGDVFVVNTCIQPGPVICLPPEWISVMPNGSEPLFGVSGAPSLSANGRFVAFHSNSPLTGINTGRTQIFVRDRQTNVTTMVSVDAMGNAGSGDSMLPAISGNGRYVAFVSGAANLIPNDTNNRPDVFVYDTCFGASGLCIPGPERVSVATGGVEVVGAVSDFFLSSISEDGRYVVFTSSASTLVPNDTNAGPDVFIHDRLGSPVPTTTRVSLNTNGAQFFGANGIVNSDGRFVTFDAGQAFVYDTCFGAPAGCTPGSVIVSRVPGGANANGGGANQPAISGDGRWVVFQSGATNLLPGITSGIQHIYRARTN